jgi:hypothetical protein
VKPQTFRVREREREREGGREKEKVRDSKCSRKRDKDKEKEREREREREREKKRERERKKERFLDKHTPSGAVHRYPHNRLGLALGLELELVTHRIRGMVRIWIGIRVRGRIKVKGLIRDTFGSGPQVSS